MVMQIRKLVNKGISGSSEKKNSEKDLNIIEARFAQGKQKMNSLKMKLKKCGIVKGKLNMWSKLQMKK